jgi:hypothetical protein
VPSPSAVQPDPPGMPAASTFQYTYPPAHTGPSIIVTTAPESSGVMTRPWVFGSERTRLDSPGVTLAWPPTCKRVKPLAQAGVAEGGAEVPVGAAGRVAVGRGVGGGVEVRVSIGVAVGGGVEVGGSVGGLVGVAAGGVEVEDGAGGLVGVEAGRSWLSPPPDPVCDSGEAGGGWVAVDGLVEAAPRSQADRDIASSKVMLSSRICGFMRCLIISLTSLL